MNSAFSLWAFLIKHVCLKGGMIADEIRRGQGIFSKIEKSGIIGNERASLLANLHAGIPVRQYSSMHHLTLPKTGHYHFYGRTT